MYLIESNMAARVMLLLLVIVVVSTRSLHRHGHDDDDDDDDANDDKELYNMAYKSRTTEEHYDVSLTLTTKSTDHLMLMCLHYYTLFVFLSH
jgi:uncharacterized membrane protein